MSLFSNGESGSSVRTKLNNAVSYVVEKTLTSSDLLSINASPVEVIPAPGAGKYLVLKWGEALYIPGAIPYSSVSALICIYETGPTDRPIYVVNTEGDLSRAIDYTSASAIGNYQKDDFINAAMVVTCGNDWADGDGQIFLHLEYAIRDVPS